MTSLFRLLTPRRLVAALAVALLSVGVAAPALAATEEQDPSSSVSWGARPDDTAQGEGRPNFVYDLAPGDELSDALLVTNRGEEPIELAVYAADGKTTADGTLDLLPSGEESTELGAWIDVEQDSVALAPDESASVPFDLAVPADAQPGDYAAGVVAAMRVEGEDGIVTERRLGSRVLLRVAGDLAPALEVSGLEADFSGGLNPFLPGSATIDVTLTNTGNATLVGGADVSVSGPFGIAARAVDMGEIPELLPGTSLTRTVEVAEAWPLIVFNTEVAASADVVVREGAVPPPTATVTDEASTQTWAVPWTLLVVVVLLIALVVWRTTAAKRRKRAHEAEVARAVEQALASRESEPVGV